MSSLVLGDILVQIWYQKGTQNEPPKAHSLSAWGPRGPLWASHVAHGVPYNVNLDRLDVILDDLGLILIPCWPNIGRFVAEFVDIFDVLGQLFMICWIRRYAARGTTKKEYRAKPTINVLQIIRSFSENDFKKTVRNSR